MTYFTNDINLPAQKISTLEESSSLKKPKRLQRAWQNLISVGPMVGCKNGKSALMFTCFSGESGDVRGDTVQSWKERLPELLHGFKKKNFGTLMRQDAFGKPYLTVGLDKKERSVKEGKKNKQ